MRSPALLRVKRARQQIVRRTKAAASQNSQAAPFETSATHLGAHDYDVQQDGQTVRPFPLLREQVSVYDSGSTGRRPSETLHDLSVGSRDPVNQHTLKA